MARSRSSRRSSRSRGASRIVLLVGLTIAVAVALLVPGGLESLLDRLGYGSAGASAQQGSWSSEGEDGDPPVASTADTAPTTEQPALEVLATLEVKGRAPKTGYDREDRFGSAWFDIDRNGCDTRNDVLQRDLVDEVLSGPCRVLSGRLADPYTGGAIDFIRGVDTSPLVQIDHVVALSDAWQKGAQQLDHDQRVSLANDPLNLLAVDGPTNSAKGDGDAATWLPPRVGARCDYAARQVAVKAAYALWVTPAEHDALEGILRGCGSVMAPVSPFAATAGR